MSSLIMSINLRDIAILNIKGSDYRCIISLISKNEAITLLQNANFFEKVEHNFFFKKFQIIHKNGKKQS